MQLKTLHRQRHPLASPQEQLAVLNDGKRIARGSFEKHLEKNHIEPMVRVSISTLQVNLGKVCNQTCAHCHVDAGPDRRESMSASTIDDVIAFLKRSTVATLDITGGAPEMNPHFKRLVTEAHQLGKHVIDRCNLTILLASGFTDLPVFLSSHAVEIVASLPCYLQENCDLQRGTGVFQKSIEAIRILNDLGYGDPNTNLQLNLVYNPVGTSLPPSQTELEQAYHDQLHSRYGIRFNRLFTITNMPISRFLDDLLRNQKYEAYMQKLIDSFNPQTLEELMCRSLVSVDWQGFLFDCDFNQMLELPIWDKRKRIHLSELTEELVIGRPIRTANHCFGCTAGAGSSCTGSLAEG